MKNIPVFLLDGLLMLAASTATAEEQKEAHVEPGDTGSARKYHVRISKLEKQFSTENDDGYGEWAGLAMFGDDLNTLWLTTKGSTQHGETVSSEIRLF